MRKRTKRQDIIRSIVRTQSLRTQRDLADALAKQGCDCTQATVSRDIAELGLQKSEEGVYALPADLRMRRMVTELLEDVEDSGNMVVVHTYAGAAAGVAGAIDEAELDEVVGTVAGDDTIFIVARSATAASQLVKRLAILRRP